jgi:uncharacterized protein YaaN involved in tellurite resistance
MSKSWEPKPLFNNKMVVLNDTTIQERAYEPGALNLSSKKTLVPTPLKSNIKSYEPRAVFPTIAKFKKELNFTITDEMLSPYKVTKSEVLMIKNIIKEVDLDNTQKTLKFGSMAQDNFTINANIMVEISQLNNGKIIEHLKTIKKTMEESSLHDIMDSGILKKLFNRSNPMERFKNAIMVIDPLINTLDQSIPVLTSRIHKFEEVMTLNSKNYIEFNVYIIACELILSYYKNTIIPMFEKTSDKDNIFQSKEFKNVQSNISLMENRLTDLKISKVSTLQSIPQIEMLRDNCTKLLNKISGTILLSYPLWKKQYSTVLILLESKSVDGLDDAIACLLSHQKNIIEAIQTAI